MPNDAIEDLFPSNKDIGKIFRELIDKDTELSADEIKMFLKNLERIILTNETIFPQRMNAFDYALQNEKYKSAETLIKGKKVNINRVDQEGNTPLIICILHNSEDAYDFALKLLGQKCKVEIQNDFGENALIVACQQVTDVFLKLIDILLNIDVDQQQFVLDNNGFGGLDYLVDNTHMYLYSEEGVKLDFDLTMGEARELKRFFEDLVVKYFKLYKDRHRENDEVYMRNLLKLCEDEKLKRTFSTKLREIGIDLEPFCNRSVVATVAEVGVQKGQFLPIALKKTSIGKKLVRASLMEPVVAERVSSDDSELSVNARAMGSSDEYEYIPYIPPERRSSSEGGRRKKTQKNKKTSNKKTKRHR